VNDWSNFLSHLSTEPGIYRMLDAEATVLYVGKASNLKKRVSSYFKSQGLGIKTQALLKHVVSIEVTITRSETEALLLESHLIKSLQPKYNVLMRDDKTYPYLHFSNSNGFPRVEILRSKRRPKGGDFLGPYPSIIAVRHTVNVIRQVFKLRNCSDSYFSHRSRPCLQYQIQRCSAPCTAYISQQDYQQSVADALRFLQGKSSELLNELAKRMDAAVERLAFEEAARLRDQIKHLRLIQEQQGVAALQGDADVIVVDVQSGVAIVQWVRIREGQVDADQSFFPQIQAYGEDETAGLWNEVFEAFIAHYYIDMPERIPALILTDHPVSEHALLQESLSKLRGKSCRIQVGARGLKARWLDFARNNLQAAKMSHRSKSSEIASRYKALQDFLQISVPIERMECFDISHTQGVATVASCVVFDAKGPCKREYRLFNIQGITAGDDYAAMEQALTRRFRHDAAKLALPQLLIIDGGLGQVRVADKVLKHLNIDGVKLLGIAKGPSRKPGLERLILVDEGRELNLAADSAVLHLLQHIRDESHRFAISRHRKKRQKLAFDSSLEEIPGIGAKRKQALLKRFGGFREIAKAPLEELAKTKGISRSLAERIYQYFQR
jgi:excinuclease ABC subunit C